MVLARCRRARLRDAGGRHLTIVILLLGGLVYFKSTERTFADLI